MPTTSLYSHLRSGDPVFITSVCDAVQVARELIPPRSDVEYLVLLFLNSNNQLLQAVTGTGTQTTTYLSFETQMAPHLHDKPNVSHVYNIHNHEWSDVRCSASPLDVQSAVSIEKQAREIGFTGTITNVLWRRDRHITYDGDYVAPVNPTAGTVKDAIGNLMKPAHEVLGLKFWWHNPKACSACTEHEKVAALHPEDQPYEKLMSDTVGFPLEIFPLPQVIAKEIAEKEAREAAEDARRNEQREIERRKRSAQSDIDRKQRAIARRKAVADREAMLEAESELPFLLRMPTRLRRRIREWADNYGR